MEREAPSSWTAADVERQLIEAFRRLPSCPVFSAGAAIRTPAQRSNEVTSVLEWGALIPDDADGRKHLWAWARCKATCSSFADLCRGLSWSQSVAERGRRRAAEAIAAALNDAFLTAATMTLDSGKTRAGASTYAAA